MKNARRSHVYLTIAVLCFGLTAPLAASTFQTIFDNSQNDLKDQFDPGTIQVGDEIILAGTARFLTTFSFEYWAVSDPSHPTTFAGNVQARVEFYENDGPAFNGYSTPGTSFYDSGWFSVPAPTSRNTFVFTAGSDFPVGGLFMPVATNMTWTVQFQGLGAGDRAGVDLYSPPIVGGDYTDYWQNDPTKGWELMTNTIPGVPVDFAALMQATVPEPSTVALSICGGLGLLLAARRFRRRD